MNWFLGSFNITISQTRIPAHTSVWCARPTKAQCWARLDASEGHTHSHLIVCLGNATAAVRGAMVAITSSNLSRVPTILPSKLCTLCDTIWGSFHLRYRSTLRQTRPGVRDYVSWRRPPKGTLRLFIAQLSHLLMI